ncbi:hypothetical protein [Streptomyces sp. NEAU-YJ-81]|uniref:hypothetical protein n=1 Tax=Streptomyces sp. NEAU-YJ-81 TaxID=2820288 RepID=UPI001ABD3D1B|nr:hypothetical protein [Streptomyces sp. NEAU-YJ-81]MBO3681364.1 hypothetical protein [Streptomyces sp. NEAU-YJ-81]
MARKWTYPHRTGRPNSSITHKNAHLDFDDLMSEHHYNASAAYGASKLANTVFGIELDRRLRAVGSPVISVLAHPGVSRSNLSARAWADRGWFGRLAAQLFLVTTQPTEHGTLPQLHAATAPHVEGGQLFGPNGRGERRGDVTEGHASAEAADPASLSGSGRHPRPSPAPPSSDGAGVCRWIGHGEGHGAQPRLRDLAWADADRLPPVSADAGCEPVEP